MRSATRSPLGLLGSSGDRAPLGEGSDVLEGRSSGDRWSALARELARACERSRAAWDDALACGAGADELTIPSDGTTSYVVEDDAGARAVSLDTSGLDWREATARAAGAEGREYSWEMGPQDTAVLVVYPDHDAGETWEARRATVRLA